MASHTQVSSVSKSEDGLTKGFVVRVDGVDGPRYQDIRKETPLFSENGRSIAYCARKDGKWHWVINGVEGPAFEN